MEDLTLIDEPVELLEGINSNRGLIWEKISEFKDQVAEFEVHFNIRQVHLSQMR